MDPRYQQVANSLSEAVARLDTVLTPWGFTFIRSDVQSSHCGPFASGHYERDTTRIGISCRDTIDNVLYSHSFITQHPCCRESETFAVGHDTLMAALGYADDCRLVPSSDLPDAIIARDGGDRISALLYDLTVIAAPMLRTPCDEFYTIVRRGHRTYSIS